MLFERIESKGLAHYSYLVGDRGEAFVVDPRRDVGVYLDIAARRGCRIAHVLETHRQEDFVLGSIELGRLSGAEVWHADAELPYRYGRPAANGQEWRVGRLVVTAVATPGHTAGSMSYVVHDPLGAPWVVFTGDALFAGDVGRVDLPGPERMAEMAGLLHTSLFRTLLPLGDGVIACPSHGAGSVCGTAIADRPWTTFGLEKLLNPKLALSDRAAFIAEVGKTHERPPYFRRMETLNLDGAPALGSVPVPAALAPAEFHERAAGGAFVLDTRFELAFATAHVPGALSIWLGGLASFAGWFVPYDRPVLLVTEGDDPRDAALTLARMGYDNVEGCLAGGMLAWHTAGLVSERTATVTVQELCRLIDEGSGPAILDIRGTEEVERTQHVPDAIQLPATELPERMGEVPRNRRLHIFCGSGVRSMMAASLLAVKGIRDTAVVLGGLSGWASVKCPLDRGR